MYDVGDVVYLKESAAIGSIESVRISGVHKHNHGWLYTIESRISQPQHASVYGDRVSQVNAQVMLFTEEEFVTYCDALSLAETNALSILSKIQARRSLCQSDGTNATG